MLQASLKWGGLLLPSLEPRLPESHAWPPPDNLLAESLVDGVVENLGGAGRRNAAHQEGLGVDGAAVEAGVHVVPGFYDGALQADAGEQALRRKGERRKGERRAWSRGRESRNV